MIDAITQDWIRNESDRKAAEAGCRFDVKRGAYTVFWIERYCRLYEGEWAGEPLYLHGCRQCDDYRLKSSWEFDAFDDEAEKIGVERAKRYAECVKKGHTLDWQYECVMRMFSWVRQSKQWKREIRRFREAFIVVAKKNRKALALDTPIPTPSGWSTMGDLVIGSTVFDERGQACRVVDVSDITFGNVCYEVEFSDGCKIVADAGHLWQTKSRKGGGGDRTKGNLAIRTTEEIARCVRVDEKGTEMFNHSVAVANALDLPHVKLFLDPYILGNLIGCESPTSLLDNKHIPRAYLRSSRLQRRALLQGLMDANGRCDASGECVLCTTKGRLADDVHELLVSLGLNPTGTAYSTSVVYKFWAFRDNPVFRMPRKLERQKERPARQARSESRHIVAVRPVPSVPVRCIAVDSPSHLYLAGRSMIPTHNTPSAASLAMYLLCGDGEPGQKVFLLAKDGQQVRMNMAKHCQQMMMQSPELSEECTINHTLAQITHTPTNSVCLPLSSSDKRRQEAKEGLNGSAIVDECLVAGTLVSTPYGEIAIEQLRSGDSVYHAAGVGKVKYTMQRQASDLYKVEFSNGATITCTGGHPIFTSHGWIEARHLKNGDVAFGYEDVCRLWQGVCSPAMRKRVEYPELLLGILQQEVEEGHSPQVDRERQWEGGLRSILVTRLERKEPQTVYNLHVSGHPSYYACGVLVHNCHVVDRDLMRRISRMGISRSEPMRLEVTTAGNNPDGYGRERYEYARRVMDGEVDDQKLFVAIYAAPQDLTDEELDADPIKYGQMANPAWGHTVDPEEFLEDYQSSKAKGIAELLDFKMYRLNIWQRASNPWLKESSWSKCLKSYQDADLEGERCWSGLDLSRTRDMSALVHCFHGEGDEEYLLLPRFWVPEARFQQLAEKVPEMLDWQRRGYLRVTPGAVTDYGFIQAQFRDDARKFNIQELAYDPRFAEETTQTMSEGLTDDSGKVVLEGTGVARYLFRQNDDSFAAPTADFERFVMAGTLRHNGHPVLSWQAGHAHAKVRPSRSKHVMKPSADDYRTVDGIVAAIMALARATAARGTTEEWYRPGMLSGKV